MPTGRRGCHRTAESTPLDRDILQAADSSNRAALTIDNPQKAENEHYVVQEEGLDTVDANRALGLPDDCREYSSVRNILQDLGISSIRLMVRHLRVHKCLMRILPDCTRQPPGAC
jgi:hypothetical protein